MAMNLAFYGAGDRARPYLEAAVGYPTRHTDVVLEAREYLGANPVPLALGWWLAPPEPASLSGGRALSLLWDDACRMVDALRFFCGEVRRVHAQNAGSAG